VIIISYTLYILYRSGALNKAIQALLVLNKKRKVLIEDPDNFNSNDYTKFEPKMDGTIPDLPFEIYIDKPDIDKPKFKVKVPVWLGYLFVNRSFVFKFANKDIGSKLKSFFFNKETNDPILDEKLINSILKEIENLDKP